MRLLIGVSGGIAAYKALETARLAVKAGHAVRVIQTPTSERFVGKASFAGITGAPVDRASRAAANEKIAACRTHLADRRDDGRRAAGERLLQSAAGSIGARRRASRRRSRTS